MARLVYYIVHHENQWKVFFDNKYHGPYATQAAAKRDAIDAAHGMGRAGHDAEIRVQGTNNNQWVTEWTYGHDPYPPKG